MALMLAPYNEAMRLGMGFNSYTQQLCCNDVVRLSNGKPATEENLRNTLQQPSQQQLLPSSGAESSILSTQKGSETILQKRIGVGQDKQNMVSQVVDWHASFVDSVSDVTKKLDISGALSVSLDALGSVKVAGRYVDENALKTSDATYDITVNVTNQRLEAPDVTRFAPIPNIEPSRFQEVYGDCFISGFLEGGLFHALVTCNRIDDRAAMSASGELTAEAKVSGLDIKGEFKASYSTGTTKQKYTTNITVNWSGGGDIRDDDITEWDIKSLTRAAMDFPDRVAACPQKTYAVLTKYTSLRSFHEATNKGSPLDYENAGIYTNSLLDAYMDYKFIWSEIQGRIGAVDRGLMEVQKSTEHEGLVAYRDSFAQSYKARMDLYNEAAKAAAAEPEKYRGITLEPPMPYSPLRAYSADLYGLDQAKRDCRFEMIKIVREVKAVSLDPQVAVDPSRIWQYVAPSIFRRLVPSDKPIDKKIPTVTDAIKQDVAKKIEDAARGHQSEATTRESFYQSGQANCDLEKRVNLRYGHLAEHWRVDSINGQSTTPSSAQTFNDLEVLDKTYSVTNITVWHDNKRLVGIQLLYQNGQVLFHGVKDSGYQSCSFNIDSSRKDNPERVNLVWLEAHADAAGRAWVDTMRIVTPQDLFIVEPSERLKYNNSFELKATRPKSSDDWDLKGFYGSFDPSEKGFAQLSPIWGRAAVDDPVPKSLALFEPEAWSSVLAWPIASIDGLTGHVHRGDKYRLSHPRGGLSNTTGKLFNALDHINESWEIKKAYFYFNNLGDMSVLSGIAVDYTNNKQLQHGKCGPGMLVQTWEPSKKDNERIVGVSTCFEDRLGQSQCSLGLRLFFESEEEVEQEKKEQPADADKAAAAASASDASADKTAAPSDASKAESKTAKPVAAPPPPPKKKTIKKSDLWISGAMGRREHGFWTPEAASPSPSRSDPSANWTIRGFMGQAGSDGIETVAVVWGRV